MRPGQPVGAGSSGGSLSVAGLFAGIGGIELGLQQAGHHARLLCELDDGAHAVLSAHAEQLGSPELTRDVTVLERLPDVDLVTAGFPCQDLSQAGRTKGIGGSQSGLVGHVFRLLADDRIDPQWVLLENVPFMLRLDRGRGMRFLVESLEAIGFDWAYRVVDTRAFGLPQRRQRVVLLASRSHDPRPVLFGGDHPDPSGDGPGEAFGFYWTEGLRGLGWARDAVPTLKGGSTIGIPSPPAIWIPEDDSVVVPDIRDAERLQGFDVEWTAPAGPGPRGIGKRWKLVGNAVSVPVARWVGERLAAPARDAAASYDGGELREGEPWPSAASGGPGRVTRTSPASHWPAAEAMEPLRDFLRFPTRPLSLRATAGFHKRALEGRLRMDPGFLEAVARHEDRMRHEAAVAGA